MKCNLKTIRINCLSVFTITALLLSLDSVPAMAYEDYQDGEYIGRCHPTGIDGTTVYLNDLEDHNWTYCANFEESNVFPVS